MSKLPLLLCILMFALNAVAQDFKFESKINPVPHKAFYDILLPPEITSKLNPDFGDIRLFDAQKNEIPYQLNRIDSSYNEIVQVSFKQEDQKKDKYSNIKIRFKEAQYLDKIRIEIEKTGYFLREAEFIDLSAKRKLKSYSYPLKAFQLSSKSENEIHFESQQKISELSLKIINNDDKPLKIKAIRAYQKISFLVAELDSSNRYVLHFGSQTLSCPVYDLKYFMDSLPQKRPQIRVQSPKNMGGWKKENQAQNFSTVIIWILLSVVLVFLGVMSYKIVKEKNT